MKVVLSMKNPFILDIFPDIFVGYERQKKELINALDMNEKYLFICGNVGVGKTTMAHWLMKTYKRPRYLYFSRPPQTIEQIENALFHRISFFNFFNKKKGYVNKLNRHTVLIIDEFNEASKECVEEIKSLVDSTQNLSLILISYSSFEDEMKREFPSLYDRITTFIKLDFLMKNEVYQLIKQRVEHANGRGIEPFTTDVVEYIYEKTQGNPREVIKLCSYLYKCSYEKKVDIVDLSFVREVEGGYDLSNKDQNHSHLPSRELKETTLTPKQKEILDLIKENGELTPPDIVKMIDVSQYSSELHALRAVNNILRFLEGEGYLKRKRQGRRYVYYI